MKELFKEVFKDAFKHVLTELLIDAIEKGITAAKAKFNNDNDEPST